MHNRIDLNENTNNDLRKFGSANVYYPVIVKTNDGEYPALFTKGEIEKALVRAEKNEEDCPVKRKYWWGWSL